MTTLPNLDDLARLAREATQGPWGVTEDVYGGKEEAWCRWHQIGPFTLTGEKPDANGRFIAAASPAAVMGLLERLQRAEKLLATIHNEADVYRQKPDDTRQWCPELSVYLRGGVGLLVLLTPDEYTQLEQIAKATNGQPSEATNE